MPNELDLSQYETDKTQHASHIENYGRYFSLYAEREIVLLELGVYKGGSLLMWRDYFSKGRIIGLDINPVTIEDPSGRIVLYQGRQEDTQLLDQIAREKAQSGFDIIIDDCSHIGALSRISFWHLFDHYLKPGGIYAIEDWGAGYWESWPDGHYFQNPVVGHPTQRMREGRISRLANIRPLGKWIANKRKASYRSENRFPSHDYGMVGFIKELVDECGMADLTCPGLGISPHRLSKFHEMLVTPGLVIILKSHKN
jgi:SAM-dependent methyltransferase